MASAWVLGCSASVSSAGTPVIVPDEFSTIQSALDAGAAEISVRPGTYHETPIVSHPVVLVGIPAEDTGALPLVDGVILSDAQMPASYAVVNIARFHFDAPVECDFSGRLDDPMTIEIADCVLDSMLVDRTAPVRASVDWLIRGCTIWGGVQILQEPWGVRLDRNVIDGPVSVTASYGHLDVVDNVIDGPGPIGIATEFTEGVAIARNTIRAFDTGIRPGYSWGVTLSGNQIEDCLAGIVVSHVDRLAIIGNSVRRCGTAIQVSSFDHVEAISNVIEDCGTGLIMGGGEYILAHANHVTGCGTGIVGSGNHAHFRDNRVERCAGAGIAGSTYSDVTSARDTVIECDGGIHFTPEEDASVLGARVISCRGTGINLRAFRRASVDSCVVGRSGGDGIVIANEQGFQLRSCTSYLNAGSGFVISDYYRTAGPVTNNIAYRNGGYGLAGFVESQIASSCNDWFGNTLGGATQVGDTSADLTVDPRFCSVDQDDVHLRDDSPLVDVPGCGGIGALGVQCDLPTPVRVTHFTAGRVAEGAWVEWRLEGSSITGSIALERSDFPAGPWTSIQSDVPRVGATLDRQVVRDRPCWYRLVERTGAGPRTLGAPIGLPFGERFEFALDVPNPALGRTIVWLTIGRAADVTLEVLDLQGRQIAMLADGWRAAGRFGVPWETQDLRPGVYLLRARSAEGEIVRRLTTLR